MLEEGGGTWKRVGSPRSKAGSLGIGTRSRKDPEKDEEFRNGNGIPEAWWCGMWPSAPEK